MVAIRLLSRWNTRLLSHNGNRPRHQPMVLLQRSLSSTTTKSSDDTVVDDDVLTKKQKNSYICKSIYRQMLRWCQQYQHHSYPPDLIQYFTKAPKHYKLVPHLFPAHDYIHQQSMQLKQGPRETSDGPGRHHPTSATATATASMVRIYNILKRIRFIQPSADDSTILVITIRSILDVQNCIRVLYRLNIPHTQTNTGNHHNTKYEQEVEEYEKLCRNVAFEELKHLNEISVELQKCQQQRHIRLRHEFNALQSYYNDCMTHNYDPSDRILPVGQVVQHKEDRWRGIIVHWSFDSGNEKRTKRRKLLSTKVRDDFTSLTLKSYATPIENDDVVEKMDDPSQSASTSMELPYQASSIAYEIALDGAYRYFFDEGDSDTSGGESNTSITSSSSYILKRQLLQTYQTSIPTFITVQQPLSLSPLPRDNSTNMIGNIDTGTKPSLSSSTPSVLEALHDKHLCCIRNPIIRRIFTKYDFRSKSYIPNIYMNYTYPNWYPTNNFSRDNNTDREIATAPDPSSSDGINEIQNDDVDTSDRNLTKISSDMLQQLIGFALHLVSVIDNTMGKERQLLSSPHKNHRPSGTDSNDNENHRNNQLEDTISVLRNDLHRMTLIDLTDTHLVFNSLPTTKRLAMQLRNMEYVAMTILEAMYKRRRNKATITKTTQEDIDESSTMKNDYFTPKFHLGQIVRHKKYNFRGVIVGRDSEPIYNVSRWDGLRDVQNAKELPFYNVIPDQQDCIEIFGGERPIRYVCEVNLEPCPPDQMYLDVDVDVGWTKLSDGSYLPPPFERFKYGYDNDDLDTSDAINDYDAFEKCMIALESELNKWHCECARNKLLQPHVSNNDDVDATATSASSAGVQQYALSIHDLLELLKVADNVEDAASIRESIKLFGKAHPNIELRTQLQYGIDLMVADNCEKARAILRSIVMDNDPNYIEAWNYLANSENFLSLQKDAFASAKKVLELNNKDFQAYTQLGILCFQQGEYSKAEINFRKCLDLDPWSIVSSKLSECIDIINERNDGAEHQ